MLTDIRLSRFTRTDLGALTSTATVESIIARVRPPENELQACLASAGGPPMPGCVDPAVQPDVPDIDPPLGAQGHPVGRCEGWEFPRDTTPRARLPHPTSIPRRCRCSPRIRRRSRRPGGPPRCCGITSGCWSCCGAPASTRRPRRPCSALSPPGCWAMCPWNSGPWWTTRRSPTRPARTAPAVREGAADPAGDGGRTRRAGRVGGPRGGARHPARQLHARLPFSIRLNGVSGRSRRSPSRVMSTASLKKASRPWITATAGSGSG